MRRSDCRPWRGCRRRSRRCRRRPPPRLAAPAGRSSHRSGSVGRSPGRSRSRPSTLGLVLLVGDRALDDQDERIELAPRGACENGSTNSSPFSYARKGLWSVTAGSVGMAPRTRSSILGWVAAVMAMVSPSQLRPAVIQRTSISGGDTLAPSARLLFARAASTLPLMVAARPVGARVGCTVLRYRLQDGLGAVRPPGPARGN